jgi:hypothetical protein
VAVKKVPDRGVFVPAHTLAANCHLLKGTVGEDYLLNNKTYNITTVDMSEIGRCTGYIEGVADEFRGSIGSPYHPFAAARGELPVLIKAFLKRVAEHPEEADLAASTVLQEADNDLLRLCGDCGFGLLVAPGGRK